jgi:hypothetical protein
MGSSTRTSRRLYQPTNSSDVEILQRANPALYRGGTCNADWVTEPEYNPENAIGYVAETAAKLGKSAAHISRVIVDPYEINPNMNDMIDFRLEEKSRGKVLTCFRVLDQSGSVYGSVNIPNEATARFSRTLEGCCARSNRDQAAECGPPR